jgi:hypothetical protein
MLERVVSESGVVFYRSPVLARVGVAHAFSTRVGGVSGGPFCSLNFGNPAGALSRDAAENIAENYRRLLSAAGFAFTDHQCVRRVHQVHGAGVAVVRRGAGWYHDEKADAIVTADPHLAVSVRTADCVPVLLATADGGRVAAVHAGWRGILAGAVPEALRELAPGGKAMVAAIGPAIGPGAFEVGEDVAREFRIAEFSGSATGNESPVVHEGGDGRKPRLDLREAIRRQLLRCGVAPEGIDSTDRCTHSDAAEFFSHRREQGLTGRMVTVIAPRG